MVITQSAEGLHSIPIYRPARDGQCTINGISFSLGAVYGDFLGSASMHTYMSFKTQFGRSSDIRECV